MQKLRLRLLAALSMDPTGMSILLGLVTSIALGMLLGAYQIAGYVLIFTLAYPWLVVLGNLCWGVRRGPRPAPPKELGDV